MEQQTFGNMIARQRKAKGMTQMELAQRLGITDKAVSKWERDLSYPDVESLPKIAEIFGVSVGELMQVKTAAKEKQGNNTIAEIVQLALQGIALAMGIATVVLSALNKIDLNSAIGMLGLGPACLAITQLPGKEG